MYLIDTHAHIYLPEFDRDREARLQEAASAGVDLVLMPAIDSATHAAMLELEKADARCKAMMGLHPCSVRENVSQELEVVEAYLDSRSFVAVGEIGLDFYWDKTFTKQQYEAFHRQIALALRHRLPIVIHSRNALDECMDVVEGYPGLTGVFHCFSGSYEQARRALDTGFYLGIGGVVTFKNSGLDKVVAQTGLEGLVLETDAPYLAPVPYRGKRNEPAYIPLIAEKVAVLCGTDTEKVARVTTENAKKLFALS